MTTRLVRPASGEAGTAMALVPSGSKSVAALSPAEVVELQSVKEYPALSLLMTTTPSPVMAAADAVQLRLLAHNGARRLRAEAIPGVTDAMVSALEVAVDEAAAGATSAAVAIYLSPGTVRTLHLPVPVRDRVVVDPTFATRDLVRCLHRTPRHVVLALSSAEARLFDGVGGILRPAGSAFPMRAERQPRSDASRPRLAASDTAAFLRTVDRALGTYLRVHPAPLVLVGPSVLLAEFSRVSANVGRLAGTVAANIATDPLPELASRIRPILETYLLSREQEALDLLERRKGAGRSVSGMDASWLAARRESPEMLAVEQGLFYPARVSPDGDTIEAAWDVEHPEVLDDAVDELIELVLERGGWVALVEDGALAAHGGVALSLRSRD